MFWKFSKLLIQKEILLYYNKQLIEIKLTFLLNNAIMN